MCIYIYTTQRGTERDGEREREGARERARERETETERKRERTKERERQRATEREREKEGESHTEVRHHPLGDCLSAPYIKKTFDRTPSNRIPAPEEGAPNSAKKKHSSKAARKKFKAKP